MKLNHYHYILIFLIIFFIFIKLFTPSEISKEGFQEGLDIGGEMRKVFEKPFKEIPDKIISPFKQIIDGAKTFFSRFRLLKSGFDNIFSGIGDQFKYLGIGIGRGFEDIGLLIAYATEFVFSYVMCGVKYISNIPNCILYYITDALIQALYLPIRIVLWFLSSFLKINLYTTEKKLCGYAQWVDNKIYSSMGFNVLRWPKNVRDQCYNCKRLKTSVLVRKAREIDYDFKVGIPKLIKKGTDRIKKGASELKQFFGIKERIEKLVTQIRNLPKPKTPIIKPVNNEKIPENENLEEKSNFNFAGFL